MPPSKAALVGLARGLAVDEGPRGVTVNVVGPGWIATGSQTDDEAREGRHDAARPVGHTRRRWLRRSPSS